MSEPSRPISTENESHTPGPWLLNADAARHEPGFYGSPSEPGDPEVYTSIHVGQVRLTAFIKPADACLIAAAPDMFALLTQMEDWLRPEVEKEPDRTFFWQIVELRRKVKGLERLFQEADHV